MIVPKCFSLGLTELVGSGFGFLVLLLGAVYIREAVQKPSVDA